MRKWLIRRWSIAALVLLGAWGCGDALRSVTGPTAPGGDSIVVMPRTDFLTGSRGSDGARPARLHADPRMAIKLEAYYSLDPKHNGTSKLHDHRGWAVGGWNYLVTDLNAQSKIVGWYGGDASLWKGFPSFYNNLDVYGFTDYNRSGQRTGVWRGHGGQCRSFACRILFRSGTFQQRLPSYGACPWGYRPYTQIRVGDVIETTWANGHTAVVVGILSGVEGQSVTGVNVVDSNFAGDEVIAMHPIYVTNNGGVGDLRSYRALNLPIQ